MTRYWQVAAAMMLLLACGCGSSTSVPTDGGRPQRCDNLGKSICDLACPCTDTNQPTVTQCCFAATTVDGGGIRDRCIRPPNYCASSFSATCVASFPTDTQLDSCSAALSLSLPCNDSLNSGEYTLMLPSDCDGVLNCPTEPCPM